MTPKSRLLSALVVAGAISGAAAAPAVASPIRECGNYDGQWTYHHISGAGLTNLTTRGVSCRFARPFALSYSTGRHHAGFACRHLISEEESFDIRCTRGAAQVIRWQGGA